MKLAHHPPQRARRGYTVLLVLIFQILLLSLVGIVYRHVGAALRMEAAQSTQSLRNEGVLHALARGVSLLETGLPPSNPYECAVTINTTSGARTYVVTMNSDEETNWTVHATYVESASGIDPMPSTFATDLNPDPMM